MSQRVHQLAKELEVTSKELIAKLEKMGVSVKNHMSSVDDAAAEQLRSAHTGTASTSAEVTAAPAKGQRKKAPKKPKASAAAAQPVEPVPEVEPPAPPPAASPEPEEVETSAVLTESEDTETDRATLQLDFPLTVKEFAIKLGVKPSELIQRFIGIGVFVNINQSLDRATAERIAPHYAIDIEGVATSEDDLLSLHDDVEIDPAKQVPRSPVVTLMGHVDHGKTSLLDVIRTTNVTAGEAGGITQHIGAHEVALENGHVTFLDTPGHAAFTAMRARGAHATDVVVLVVAADDGIMPQTREAIDHARAADVPIVVAINKCDLPTADVDRVKQQLSELDLASEDWGGKTITVPVSAKTRDGVSDLLEMLLLEAELLELKANPDCPASGVVIEAELSKGRGPVATVLVSEGTLREGDVVIADRFWGRVKAMVNDCGQRVTELKPAQAAQIAGLGGVPDAGQRLYVAEDEQQAKEVTTLRQQRHDMRTTKAGVRLTLEDLQERMKEGELQELSLILKADVHGSLEVLSDSLSTLGNAEVSIRVLHSAVGDISESDILLASASEAIVIGFHVGLQPGAGRLSKREGVGVRLYSVIYEAVDDIRRALEGLLVPHQEEEQMGTAEVLKVFKISRVGVVAGCIVRDGTITRNHKARLFREEEMLYEGRVQSLKRFKDDARDVKSGLECGITLDGYRQIAAGDRIETFQVREVARTLS